uniref:AIG1-type G domain-containing protein n=1 Tax=Sparus aurata TaxID=8175 RepID=A0A671UQ21_SPAAU
MMSDRRRIVILGKTGAGKSSLANTIFGEELFKISHDPNSETRKCQANTKSVNGRSITLIDTPGFSWFDTDRSEEELKPEIVRCITECAPGPHAFLIVLKVERFTEQEQAVINKIQEYFSEESFRNATVVFTYGDELPGGETIEDFVLKNKPLDDLVKKCGGRCHNEYRSNQFQVEELLKTIDKMVTASNGRYYTNEMLQAVEEKIQQEEETIRSLSGNLSGEEIRKKAKGNVFKRFINRLAGFGTGALLGALFGAAGVLAKVSTDLRPVPMLANTIQAKDRAAVLTSAAAGAVRGGTVFNLFLLRLCGSTIPNQWCTV